MTDYCLKREKSADLAYTWEKGTHPLAVVYLHGWTACRKSKKGEAVAAVAQETGCHYVSLDYTAHGESGGEPWDFTVGKAIQDVQDVLKTTVGDMPLCIVGNSIGGWIGMWLAHHNPLQVKGFLGTAPAVDITTDIWEHLLPDYARAAIDKGDIVGPSPETLGLCFTKELFDDAKQYMLLNEQINLMAPVRILIGSEDNKVPFPKMKKIMDALQSEDVTTTLLKGANHHLSRPEDLGMIQKTLTDLIRGITK